MTHKQKCHLDRSQTASSSGAVERPAAPTSPPHLFLFVIPLSEVEWGICVCLTGLEGAEGPSYPSPGASPWGWSCDYESELIECIGDLSPIKKWEMGSAFLVIGSSFEGLIFFRRRSIATNSTFRSLFSVPEHVRSIELGSRGAWKFFLLKKLTVAQISTQFRETSLVRIESMTR